MGLRDVINKIKNIFKRNANQALPSSNDTMEVEEHSAKINDKSFMSDLKELTEEPENIMPNTQREYSQRDYEVMYFWKQCKDINYDAQSVIDAIKTQYENVSLSDTDISALIDLQRYKYSAEGRETLQNGSVKQEYMDEIDNVLDVIYDMTEKATNEARANGYNIENNSIESQKIVSRFISGKAKTSIEAKYLESTELEKGQENASKDIII